MEGILLRVLLNCSTLVKGGALQAAVSFIRSAVQQGDYDIQWHYVISQNLAEELKQFDILQQLDSVSIMDISPARNKHSRKILKAFEQSIRPDAVFTFFGPAYVNFSAPHLCGVADGWVTHGDRWAWRTVQGPKDAIRLLGAILYKAFMFRKADAWVTESATAQSGLIKRLRIQKENITIVQNSCASHYLGNEVAAKLPSADVNMRILCLSAYYRHKNLEIVPLVAKELAGLLPNFRFEFVMTLPAEGDGIGKVISKAKELGVEQHILNVGQVPVSQGPDLYRSCHVLFLPSVLETFSANYPEAMAMGLPIITTNLDFAREVCSDAALYFEPMNARDAARAITQLCQNAQLWQSLVAEGKNILHALPTQERKYEMYKSCLYALHRRNRNVGL
jgi:glycosyltransferase involved in cell wall biosynthesis